MFESFISLFIFYYYYKRESTRKLSNCYYYSIVNNRFLNLKIVDIRWKIGSLILLLRFRIILILHERDEN